MIYIGDVYQFHHKQCTTEICHIIKYNNLIHVIGNSNPFNSLNYNGFTFTRNRYIKLT